MGVIPVIKKRIAAIVASGALAASIVIAAPVGAVNYAPGLPPAQPGVPNNPPTAAPIIPSVTLVDQSVADNTPARVMRREPAERIGAAPRVPARVGQPVALVAPGLTPGATYVVSVKQPRGEYGTLGSVIGGPFATLPVFEASRRGTIIVAMTNVQTGETQYIKVRVRR